MIFMVIFIQNNEVRPKAKLAKLNRAMRKRALSAGGRGCQRGATEMTFRLGNFILSPLSLVVNPSLFTKLGGAGDRFGDELCADCANIPLVSGHNHRHSSKADRARRLPAYC